ncbi:MAG: hypothetical protein HY608_08915 [Planctomycetes bacterium]|nr:hypothetical protein [Planctomycetota bacterium]
MAPLPGLLLLLVIVIPIAVLVAIAAKKRRKDLAAWAAANGFRFRPEKDRSLDDRLPGFSCLHQGRSRYGYNFIEGERDGRGVLAFDYHYVTGSGKHQQTHVFSALVLETRLPLKPLFIRPEGFLDKVTEFFGMDDIDFESVEFSRKFYVKSSDKRWAFDVIHQKTMEFLLAHPRHTIEFQGRWVLVRRGEAKFPPPEFGEALTVAEGILERLPESMLKELRKS